MDCCYSQEREDREAAQRNKLIEETLRKDKKNMQKEVKMLLLGSPIVACVAHLLQEPVIVVRVPLPSK